MNTHVDKTHVNKSQLVSNGETQVKREGQSTSHFSDNRPEAIAQRKLQEMANSSPDFNHLAPAPDYLSIYPTLTTTQPGDTILDIFAGTSSLLSMPLMMRRNVIGFDTDPRSIDFSRKHLSYISENMLTNKEIFEIENEISDAA